MPGNSDSVLANGGDLGMIIGMASVRGHLRKTKSGRHSWVSEHERSTANVSRPGTETSRSLRSAAVAVAAADTTSTVAVPSAATGAPFSRPAGWRAAAEKASSDVAEALADALYRWEQGNRPGHRVVYRWVDADDLTAECFDRFDSGHVDSGAVPDTALYVLSNDEVDAYGQAVRSGAMTADDMIADLAEPDAVLAAAAMSDVIGVEGRRSSELASLAPSARRAWALSRFGESMRGSPVKVMSADDVRSLPN